MDALDERLGRVSLTPDGSIVAGTVGQWTLTYTVGSYGIDEGGTIKVARRFAGDWERPQFDDPKAPAYTTVTTNGEAKLRPRYDPKAHIRPWMKCIVIDVFDGCLAPGDIVTITLGDRSQGSPGIRAQSFIESAHEIRVLVDPTNACLVRRLPSSPVVAVVAGDPVTVVPIVPTQAPVGSSLVVFVKGEDAWGNPTPAPEGVVLSWEGEPGAKLEGTTLRFAAAASGRVLAAWRDVAVASNPITAYGEPPAYGKYWAELQAQSDGTVGTGTEVEYFTFGRDWARVDVMTHQGNDFQVSDEDWKRLNAVVRDFHEDGRFVVFPGFEWSANTTAGGDRNVVYRREGLPILRSSHWQIPQTAEDERTPAHPASQLFERLRTEVGLHDVLAIAHCGGRYADIRKYFDEEVGPLIEISSCWGVFEWLLWDAYEMGYRVGITANSDGHKGRPGAEGPGAGQFGIYGGLTCILAESLTRDAVFDALKERRCYGTTGPRIDLGVDVDGHPMGACIAARTRVAVTATARGTAPIESVELYRGKQIVHVARPRAFAELAGSRRVRVAWGGARIRGRGRRAIWDGTVEVEGARIEAVRTFAFDSPADGVESWTPDAIVFRSRTTGDHDGLDIWLDQAQRGRLAFRTEVGTLEVDLGALGAEGKEGHFGGLDLQARIERYPEVALDLTVELACEVEIPAGKVTPLMVKVTQTDGHLAWSSPVYVGNGGS